LPQTSGKAKSPRGSGPGVADKGPSDETVLCLTCLRPLRAGALPAHLASDHGGAQPGAGAGAATASPVRGASSPELLQVASLLATGRDDDALGALESAVERDPGSEEVWFQKAMLHIARREYGEALICLERATAIDGKDPRAWVAKFFALERVGGRSSEAARCLIRAADLDPLFTQAWIAERFTENELIEIRKRYAVRER